MAAHTPYDSGMSQHSIRTPWLESCPSLLGSLHDQAIGHDDFLVSCFGPRPLVYADYTASGRCLAPVEQHLQEVQHLYANTHTDDTLTGRHMTRLLHDAEQTIKECVNAGPGDRVIACGSGATGAIERLQQILGVALPPASRETLFGMLRRQCDAQTWESLHSTLEAHQPVVFVGPYEHHSNEISWREGLCTVVPIGLTEEGEVDLAHLERELARPEYAGRRRIGTFSAASNVTGMRTDVHAIASLLHRHGAIACFDYAAAGPYAEIDMNPPAENPDDDPSLDAVVLSPHKFLGGPGSSGILLIKDHLYRSDLPPTMAAGGTVSYVGPQTQEYYSDIEQREKPGTPGILQLYRAALAFAVKRRIGQPRIEETEHRYLQRALSHWNANPQIEVLGNPDPERRIGIVSFNITDPRGGVIHPRLVTTLLNDLFGIQSRAGCSCAGPYGHRLLAIDETTSERYRRLISSGFEGVKPGWCRVSLHYAMTDAEVDYIIDAVEFLASVGYRFVHMYEFCPRTGAWSPRNGRPQALPASSTNCPELNTVQVIRQKHGCAALFKHCLDQAGSIAAELNASTPDRSDHFEGELEELRFFTFFR